MMTNPETIRRIDEQILRSDAAICRHIENLDALGRGAVSQDILSNLRTFVEHAMFKIYAHANVTTYNYQHIEQAISFVKTKGQLKFLWRFHAYLQIVASHYTLDPEDSERVMLKYYEFMLKIKVLLRTQHGLDVLANLDKFPLNTDRNLQEYYERIAERLNSRNHKADKAASTNVRYYIHKVKPFFVNQQIYYEVTFIPAIGKASKFDRIIAFTKWDISKYYAVKLGTVADNISILGKTMPIFIIVSWEVAIRPIEIEKFSNILGENLPGYAGSAEGRGLMQFLTQTGFNLVELLCFEDAYYRQIRSSVLAAFNAKVSHLFDLFDRSREIIRSNRPGCNVLRYLLYHMNNKVIEDQLGNTNTYLSQLCLAYGCIPFDQMPFSTSLLHHNPRLVDLFDCLDTTNRMHEMLARYVLKNTERNGQLYTPRADLERFGDIDTLVSTFNRKLYKNQRHQARRLKERNGHFYIVGYENDTVGIIQRLIELSSSGVQNYINYVDDWLASAVHPVDCEEKSVSLRQMFTESSVALIYGSAGTGKSTLINHISNLFMNQSKLYLANTNPAVDNMKRRVTVQTDNTDFMTVTKFIKKKSIRTKYDIVIIDECSTVNNSDMKNILVKAEFELLVLVGDIYQIEAIQFGNWFSAARGFLPTSSINELTKPYRSHNEELQMLWDRVRGMDDRIVETIARNQYSASLDASIFIPAEPDEIILCLNYDGLYGINNINRFLQQANPNPAVPWGLQLYKIGDPILFNETDRFTPVIYNNIKGWIAGIKLVEDKIQFDIEVDKSINGLEARNCDFELLPNSASGRSVIRFTVDDHRKVDENREVPITAVVPFQVAYAVSIHKAQGLEFNSVKIIITDEIEDHITHNIFYTAITRAREKLKIYWTPEVGHRVLSVIKPKDIRREIAFLKAALTEHRT
ncbi:UvrD-like helicase family protein [Paenibacillus sp. BK033]|uniref:ATP-dependent DNA helicase n=1 Tax=Paenibacillus sp. BK033 TaxID=2512133 RepID=UPI0010429898|nr:ATP-dependent RecD-like DNA helicase [Paenibacillus sp. BK033]TCM99387.1 UvrD-like helicase family protein [Paenibacillus sp. BK033]